MSCGGNKLVGGDAEGGEECGEVVVGYVGVEAAEFEHVDDEVVHVDDVRGVLIQVIEEIGFDDILDILLAVADCFVVLVGVHIKDYSYPRGGEIRVKRHGWFMHQRDRAGCEVDEIQFVECKFALESIEK